MPGAPEAVAAGASGPRFWAAFSREAGLADHIPWSSLLDERTVLTRGGDLLTCWRLEGVTFETAGQERVADCHESVCNALCALGGGDVAVWSHLLRREVRPSLPLVSEPHFAADLDRSYQCAIGREATRATELYLTLLYRPERKNGPDVLRGGGDVGPIREREKAVLAEMRLKAAMLASALREFRPHALGNEERGGRTFSELCEFLGVLVTGRWRAIPPIVGPMHRSVAGVRLFFGGSNVEVRDLDGSRFGSLLDILEYPTSAQPGTLDCLLYEDSEFVQTQSFAMLPKREALSALQLQQRQLLASEDLAAGQVEQMSQAIEEVADGALVVGDYHYSLLVWGSSVAECLQRCARIRGAMSEQAGVHLAPVDLVPDAAYFSQWPGSFRWRPRKARLTSRAFAALSCFHSFAQGKRNGNPWGPAATVLRTPSNTPFYLNLHASPEGEDSQDKKLPGNTFLLGSTGSGKTTLELFLLAQMRRYCPAPRLVLFDVDRGSEIFIRALRGRYVTLPAGRPTGLNPFQRPATATWIRLWEEIVCHCVASPSLPLLPRDEAAISSAVRAVATIDARYRRLSAVRQNLPKDSENSLYHRLGKWCRGGALGWVFDEAPDCLADLERQSVLAFDYTEFLNDPVVRTPVMMYLLSLVESLIDGGRFVYCIAECWKALDDPVFMPFIKQKQKTIRKQNGIGIFDTQSPDDALKSSIARAMVEQCVTKICLPNVDAVRADYVEGFGLTEDEYEIVRSLGQGAGRRFLVKQNSRSAIAELDLSGMPEALLVLSGTTDNVHLLDEIRAQVGDDPDVWLPILQEAARTRARKLRSAAGG